MAGKLLLILPLIFFLSFWVFDFAFASSVIFSNGFDDKNIGFSDWQLDPVLTKWRIVSGGSADRHSGTGRAEVAGPTATEKSEGYSSLNILLKNISTTDHENINLSFWYKIKENIEDEDHVYVEWTIDGSNWVVLQDFTALAKSDTWSQGSYSLPAEAGNNTNFALRFRTELGSSGDVLYIDEITLSGDGGTSTPIPTPVVTPTPQIEASPPVVETPTPLPSATPTPSSIPARTPTASVSKTPVPQPVADPPPAETSTLSISKTPTPTSIVKKSSSSMPTPSVELIASESIDPNNLFFSIYGFAGSKSFWLLGTMVLAVVGSLAKFRRG